MYFKYPIIDTHIHVGDIERDQQSSEESGI